MDNSRSSINTKRIISRHRPALRRSRPQMDGHCSSNVRFRRLYCIRSSAEYVLSTLRTIALQELISYRSMLIGGGMLIGVALPSASVIHAIQAEVLPLKYRAVANGLSFFGVSMGSL